jgi:hypothetical protein
MPVHSPKRPRLWLGALAAAGVGLTHVLAYFLTAPDPTARRELLEQTAHGYWSYASAVALGVLVAGLSGFVISRVRERAVYPQSGRALYVFIATRLAVLQAVGFLVLEASERAVAGGLADLLAEPVVLLGLGIQAVVAALGALFLLLLGQIVEALTDASATVFVRPASQIFVPVLSFTQPHTYAAAGGATPRAPPAS